MTDHTTPNPQSPSRPATTPRRRGRSLYRTVLSLAVAAMIAAALPFSAMYVTALHKRPANVTAISLPALSGNTARVITTASGTTRVVPASGSPGVPATFPTPVITRDS
jgi:hypothetical protein